MAVQTQYYVRYGNILYSVSGHPREVLGMYKNSAKNAKNNATYFM